MNRKYSLMSGIFTVLNNIQELIFGLNQPVWIGFDEQQYSLFMEVKSKTVHWILVNSLTITTVLSIITIITSIFFLYCLHTNNYMGLVVYSIWIIIYELISFSLNLISAEIIKNEFKDLNYLNFTFQILRMLLHFLALPFIVKYIYSLYLDSKIRVQESRCRPSLGSMTNVRSVIRQGPLYQHRVTQAVDRQARKGL